MVELSLGICCIPNMFQVSISFVFWLCIVSCFSTSPINIVAIFKHNGLTWVQAISTLVHSKNTENLGSKLTNQIQGKFPQRSTTVGNVADCLNAVVNL